MKKTAKYSIFERVITKMSKDRAKNGVDRANIELIWHIRGHLVDIRGHLVDIRGHLVDIRGHLVDIRGHLTLQLTVNNEIFKSLEID